MKDHTQAPEITRKCNFCAGPIPASKRSHAVYCSSNCKRRAFYNRKTPEQRTKFNKRNNQRRYVKDLLPRIQLLKRIASELHAGSDVGYAIAALVHRQTITDWRWSLAIGYAQSQEALVHLAGGPEYLEEIIEDELEAVALH
ncbi:hypothetical protein [Ruegeria atlantica]|uniref:DUF2116 family Zn-ribbon domain-containing protein n=1 Tax=Ruegeria atlantica TaxID=81569 RepID=A0ABX1WDZ0_9RHOB|nr:hypothetical protein [Ruegeria atlantica]NOD31494.1 hypothetical protein [Ruegeria atlantica]